MLNFVLLATCICIIIVLILFLFYWNRFFAFILGLLFRLYSWNQEEASVWLSIGSVHFSILSGRILFKDLRYHSSNQTFRIVKGQVSWRYWLRSPAEEEDLSHARVVGEDINVKHQPLLPCRIHMSFQGLEWFMYNRTAAFDNIIKQLDSEIPDTPAPTPIRLSTDGRGSILKIFSRTSGIHDSSVLGPPVSLISSIYKRTPTIVKRAANWLRLQLPNLDPKDLLPISIEATKGAIICGNASTPNLLVAEFNGAEGTYGIVEARSKHDLYKQMLNIKFQNASACYVENTDYHAPMSDIGHKVHEHIRDSHSSPLRQSTYLSFLSFQRLWSHLKLWTLDSSTHPRSHTFFPRASVTVPHPPSWGRKKHHMNADDETPLGADFAMLEYAIERKFMEAPTLELLYYADVVGVVPIPEGQQSVGTESLDPFDIGNGDLPPEWGIDIVVRGVLCGTVLGQIVNVILQRAFFPQVYHDVEPAPRLKPGDTRKWTGLKIFIELRDGVALQIPFRESSKNWQWDGQGRHTK
ncbi:hypothetical protein A0H81_11865 [Grifola frondosa]|uniref:Csf1 N-terminal domain-containing protein n=1 Tax=Grifola frondosa TaxID=5627 RepID=A0A1C7LVN3_GRIFR|nr:hypothetical protein A0H81_11865 [Grifola frondosa]